jgi:hypothetical protein
VADIVATYLLFFVLWSPSPLTQIKNRNRNSVLKPGNQ